MKLDNIMVDGRKIHANFLGYVRRNPIKSDAEGRKDLGVTEDCKWNANQKLADVNKVMDSSIVIKEGRRSFVDVIQGGNAYCHLNFNTSSDNLARLKKAYVGVIVNPGMSYNI